MRGGFAGTGIDPCIGPRTVQRNPTDVSVGVSTDVCLDGWVQPSSAHPWSANKGKKYTLWSGNWQCCHRKTQIMEKCSDVCGGRCCVACVPGGARGTWGTRGSRPSPARSGSTAPGTRRGSSGACGTTTEGGIRLACLSKQAQNRIASGQCSCS